MERPATIADRQQLAAQQTAPPGTEAQPYEAGFAEELAYRFASSKAPEIPAVLAACFPQPDAVDCAYLTALLDEIERTRFCEKGVGCGTEFVFWGIEYSAQKMTAARKWVSACQTPR